MGGAEAVKNTGRKGIAEQTAADKLVTADLDFKTAFDKSKDLALGLKRKRNQESFGFSVIPP